MFRCEKVKAEWRILVRISFSLFFSVCPHESGEHENGTADRKTNHLIHTCGCGVRFSGLGVRVSGLGLGLNDAVFVLVGAAEQTVVACFFISPELSPVGREAFK